MIWHIWIYIEGSVQAELARMQSGMSFTENPYMASKFQAEQQALMADLLPLDFGSPPTPPLSRETSDKQRRTKSSLYKVLTCSCSQGSHMLMYTRYSYAHVHK